MQFSRVILTFLVVVTFGAFVLSTPAVVKQQDTSDIMTILNTLQTNIGPPLTAMSTFPALFRAGSSLYCDSDATGANGTASADTISPLMDQVVSALGTASLGWEWVPTNNMLKRTG
jgi:hypothetical protein